MEVAQKNGCFTASNNKYDSNQKDETEHVVQLVRPETKFRNYLCSHQRFDDLVSKILLLQTIPHKP